jgi:hypothetical protein
MIDLKFNNSFEKQLEEAGYKWFKDNWKNSIRGFQKRFTDDKGIKYFINGYHYNFYKQHISEKALDIDKYTFDCQFNIGDNVVDLQFSNDFLPNEFRKITTLKEVEEFYEKFFIDNKCKYYEEW